MHVLVPGGCTGPLVGGTCTLRFFNPCNSSTPEEDPCHPCNSKRQGGGFGGAQIALMYPARRFLVELPTPGGLRREAAIDHPVSPQLFLHNHPLPCLTPQTRQIWQQNWSRSKPCCPNFRRLDQSMQIAAATAIAFAFEMAKDCWGIVPSSDYLSSE